MVLFKKMFIVILLLVIVLLMLFYGIKEYYKKEIKSKIHVIDTSTKSNGLLHVDFNKLESLPYPVGQYFKNVLKNGQPYIKRVFLTQSGKLTVGPQAKEWSQFKAEQNISAMKPAFLWNAEIPIISPIHIRVVDSYINGKAEGIVFFQSVLKVSSENDNPKLNSGALFRYLAEAVWYPTALLPGNGVKWVQVNKNKSIATISDSEISVSLEFTFNSKGEIIKIFSKERYGLFEGKYQKYPWEGKFSNYIEVDGMRIPKNGEVGWHLPEGFWQFWKGNIENIKFYYK